LKKLPRTHGTVSLLVDVTLAVEQERVQSNEASAEITQLLTGVIHDHRCVSYAAVEEMSVRAAPDLR